MALLELTEDLRFVDLFVGSHMIAKQWSDALRLHPCKPDGIR
jgi:hypothetical protein